MKYIISGTNRKDARTLQVAKLVQSLYQAKGESVEIIDLAQLNLNELSGDQYGAVISGAVGQAIAKLNQADGIVVIVPEYNGSYPGALKYFIDFWKYPETFEYRPVSFVGLGGTFGGLRPVEHLQQVFGYRNAFVFPERVFLFQIWDNLKNGTLTDEKTLNLLGRQVEGFQKFTQALMQIGLHANARKK